MTDTSSNTPSTAPTPDTWFVRHAEHQRREAELLPANKTSLLQALGQAGVSIVVITFDGYGDSGQIESVEARAGDAPVALPDHKVEILQLGWNETEPQRREMSLSAAAETVFWDILSAKHSGWQDNDGGFGEFTIDVSGNSITLDYNERISDSEHYAYAF